MARKLAEIQAELQEIGQKLEAYGLLAKDEDRNLSDDEQKDFLALEAKAQELETEKESAERFEAALARVAERAESKPAGSVIQPKAGEEKLVKLPAKAKSVKSEYFADNKDAYVAGQYLLALAGNHRAKEFLNVQEIGTDNKGGFLVPEPLAAELINLLNQYGVARRYCGRKTMSAETWTVPKLSAHSTVYYPAESAAITASDMTFEQITLTAKKMAALIKMSSEVTEDSIIPLLDEAIRDIAYQMSVAEDENLFNGVASAINATGIKGDASVADTNVASVSAITLANLTAASIAPTVRPAGARNAWFMHPTLFNGKIRDLVNAAGGNTIADLEGGQRPMLLGYPVVFAEALSDASASTSGDLLAVFGDLSLGYYFGDRRSLNFQVLNELFAVNDQVGVVATQRIDIKSANPEVLSKITLT